MISNQLKISLIWIILVICMILHFDYHVSGIFYGIEVRKPDASGVYPPTLIFIRALFQVLPMAYALLFMFFSSKAARIAAVALSVLYAPLHGFHVTGTFRETPLDPTQVQLLIFTFLVSLLLVWVSVKWLRESRTAN